MKGDKTSIKNNEKILKQKTKLKYEDYKREKIEELQERNRIYELVNENNIKLQKNKVKKLIEERDENIKKTRERKKEELENKPKGDGILSKLANMFERNKESPIFDLKLTPKEREAYEKAIKKMKGGTDDNMLNYEFTDESKTNMCNKIKEEKNIYKENLSFINNCF